MGMNICGLGVHLPDDVWNNQRVADHLRKIYELYLSQGRKVNEEDYTTDPEWIVERTGFFNRRMVNPEIYSAEGRITGRTIATSDLGTEAAKKALDVAGLSIQEIDGIICSTVTEDHPATPPTACIIQKNLKSHLPAAEREKITCLAFDLSAACSTAVYGLYVAYGMLANGLDKILLVPADVMSSLTHNRETFPLMGDAGTALVLEASDDEWVFNLGADGDYEDRIKVLAGGSRLPIDDPQIIINNAHHMQMQGRKVFKEISGEFAPQEILKTLEMASLKISDIDHFFIHQANIRMIDYITEKLGISKKTFNNGDKFGNTTSASVILALWEKLAKGLIKKGEKIMFVTFGGGYTWGIAVFTW